MLVSLAWINDFVKTPNDLSSQQLAEKLTLATAEVEEVSEVGLFWQQIRVAEITHIDPHPEADKLNIVTFKLGDEESFKVVCGADNVRIGLKSPFAPIGTTLPIGFTLEPKKIRGVLSEGMLCSEEELGLKESSSGIMELPQETPIGVTLEKLWHKTSDIIFDIDNKSLTHRPDLWGHYGFAREFATIFDQPLKDSFSDDWADHIKKQIQNSSSASPLTIKVEENSACLAYFGLSIDKVSVAPSPAWLKERLENAGLRSINNIVDISNYVMLELGHPLHIFDRDAMNGSQVTIKNLTSDETFTTLDEEERHLVRGDCVICDDKQVLVLAGIMGGLNSGVTDKTQNIFIEVANWKASHIRHTSTRLGLRSDSSSRFEKSLDSLMCEKVLLRTVELINELCPEASVQGSIEYDGQDLSKLQDYPVRIAMTVDKITKTLGKTLETQRIVQILTALNFAVEVSSADGQDHLDIMVPSFRATKDIEGPADIIEEIGRVVGYDHIEAQGPLLAVCPTGLTPHQSFKRKAQDFFSLHTYAFEVNSYPLIGQKLLEKVNWPTLTKSPLHLINALSKDHSMMRDSLIPSFLEMASLNSKSFEQCRFFELGRSYLDDEKSFFQERSHLALAFYHRQDQTFMPLLNQVQRAMSFLQIPGDLTDRHPKFKNQLVDEQWQGLHPFEFKNIRVMGKMNGLLFSVHPLLLKKLKIKGNLSLAIIDYTDVVKKAPKDKMTYRPLSTFPGSRFDFTITMKKEDSVGVVFAVLKSLKIKELDEFGVVDVYEQGSDKHVTFTTYFVDRTKTLEGDVIKSFEGKIIKALEQKGLFLKAA